MGSAHGGSKMKAGKSQAPTVHIKKFFKDAKKQVAKAKDGSNKEKGSRLYVKGVVAGFRRALTNQKNHTSRIKTEKDGTRFRVMWGKVCAPHGTSGVSTGTVR